MNKVVLDESGEYTAAQIRLAIKSLDYTIIRVPRLMHPLWSIFDDYLTGMTTHCGYLSYDFGGWELIIDWDYLPEPAIQDLWDRCCAVTDIRLNSLTVCKVLERCNYH